MSVSWWVVVVRHLLACSASTTINLMKDHTTIHHLHCGEFLFLIDGYSCHAAGERHLAQWSATVIWSKQPTEHLNQPHSFINWHSGGGKRHAAALRLEWIVLTKEILSITIWLPSPHSHFALSFIFVFICHQITINERFFIGLWLWFNWRDRQLRQRSISLLWLYFWHEMKLIPWRRPPGL